MRLFISCCIIGHLMIVETPIKINQAEDTPMTKFDVIDDIRKALTELIEAQESVADDDEAFQVFKKAYLKLLAQFYKENNDMIATRQYEAAKSDPEYFMSLVLLTSDFYKDDGIERGRVLH